MQEDHNQIDQLKDFTNENQTNIPINVKNCKFKYLLKEKPKI